MQRCLARHRVFRAASTQPPACEPIGIVVPRVQAYSEHLSSPESEAVARAGALARQRLAGARDLTVGPWVGALLAVLTHALQPRRVLELGTFTGYSALWLAEVLEHVPHAHLTCVDRDAASLLQARRTLEAHVDRVTLVPQRCVEFLEQLGQPGGFDLIVMDADKRRYVQYYEAILERRLLAPTGMLLVDNVLWRGCVVGVSDAEADAAGVSAPGRRVRHEAMMHRFNRHVAADPRTQQVILPIRDGVSLITWKPGAVDAAG